MRQTANVCVEDRLALVELMAIYSWALDLGDVDAYMETWASDPVLTQGTTSPAITYAGADEIRAFASRLTASREFQGRQHFVSNLVLSGYRGDLCHMRSYLLVTEPVADGTAWLPRLCGRYEDICVFERGAWLFRSRRYDPWSDSRDGTLAQNPASRTSAPDRSCAQMGTRLSTEDRLAVVDLYSRLAWALDTGDLEGCTATFAQEGARLVDRLEGAARQAEGMSDIRAALAARSAELGEVGVQHRVNQFAYRVDATEPGDRLHVRAYVMITKRAPSGEWIAASTGYFDDIVVRRAGRWLFELHQRLPWVDDTGLPPSLSAWTRL